MNTNSGRAERRSARILLAGVAAAAVVLVGQAPAAHAATASPSAEAAAIYRDAKALRTQTAAILGQYVTDFADRFTAAEIEQLKALQAQSDAQLRPVVDATRRVSALATSKVPVARIASAAATARAAQQRARAAEATAFTNARPLVEPKLNLLERLDALNKYNAMMGKFDELGTRIDRLAKRRA